jgi:hypothetical protein
MFHRAERASRPGYDAALPVLCEIVGASSTSHAGRDNPIAMLT